MDLDFRHLFASWFNRGFLVLRPINWESPAQLLEKIIAYEAVHAIDSWDDLRRRLQPEDRRCFAFLHPVMPDEPLIFVEVALTDDVPGSIQGVLNLIGVGASALGPVTLAVAEGWFGSYPPAALSLAVLPVAVALFALGPVERPLDSLEEVS